MDLNVSGSTWLNLRSGQRSLHTVALTDDGRWVEVVRRSGRMGVEDTVAVLADMVNCSNPYDSIN